MADLADIASGVSDAFLADATRRALGKSAPESHPDFDGRHCVGPNCGVEIPSGRLALGKVMCVDCQGLKERGKL